MKYLWSTERGSLSVTGMLILERSFPMFLQSKFHKFTPAVEDIGTGSFDRLPVLDNELDFDPVSSERMTKVMFGYILVWII